MDKRPESPTTARELDFDDEPETPSKEAPRKMEASNLAETKPTEKKDPALETLKEAFPTIDAAVVKAVLTASGGHVEPAFNALLGMSDPDHHEEVPPPQPPRPNSQVDADALYARQLHEHYAATSSRDPPLPRPRQQTGLKPNEMYDKDHSFLDDDLPVIKENLRKGFLETQSKVNKWVMEFKKKIDGEEEEQPPLPPRRSADRRSADRERYDADPHVLGDDFAGLELRDDTLPPRTSSRPTANPDLFKPTPAPPNGRRVSFQEGPPEEIGESQYPKNESATTTTRSKWQPLSAVEPNPEHDPFSLGDSDDERDNKVKPEDAERLKKAAAEAMNDDIGVKPVATSTEPEVKAGVENGDKKA